MQIDLVKKEKQHLYAVETDDGQQALLDQTVWDHAGYREGDELTQQQWDALCETSADHRVRERALYYLSLRDYGSGELMKKLVQKGFDRERSRQAVERLCQAGLINDDAYAALLARDMSERKLYPKRRIALALREKGFAGEVISRVLEQLPDTEEQQALELLRKKRYNGTDDEKLREKALAMLARSGFSYACSRRAWERLREEADETEM